MARTTKLNRPLELLLVEDNPADVALMRAMLTELHVQARLSVVEDGQAALAFLHREEPYTTAVRPDLILLDLNLPKKSGLEVLAEISADPTQPAAHPAHCPVQLGLRAGHRAQL